MGLENIKLVLGMAQRGFGFIPISTHPACPEDTVIPVNVFDNNFIFRNQFIQLVYRFDRILSPDKLRRSLEELITECGWEKLGARLRSLGNKLEFHVPATFGPDRLPLRFRAQDLLTSSADDLGLIAKPSKLRCPTVGNPHATSRFLYHPPGSVHLGYFVTHDVPLMGLDIVQLADATLVCLSCPHILTDGMGLRALMRAWTAHLRGRKTEFPQPHRPTDDPLADFGLSLKSTGSQFWLEHYRRATTAFLVENTLFQNAAAFLQGTEPRSVSLPPAFVCSLKDEASLVGRLGRSEFFSEGDLISAWWVKRVTSLCMSRFVQTIAVYQLVAYHSRINSKLHDPDTPYIGNALAFIPTLLSRQELDQGSVAELATRLRRSLAKALEPAQLETYAALFRQSTCELMPNFGHGLTFSMILSNTTQLKLFDMDFGGALGNEGTQGSSGPTSCLPTTIYNFQDFAFPNFFTILGRDQYENCIITGNLRRKEWDAMENGWLDGEVSPHTPIVMAKL